MGPRCVTSASPPSGPQRPHLSKEAEIVLKGPIRGGPSREGSYRTLDVPSSSVGQGPWEQGVYLCWASVSPAVK